jgi:biotin synthase
MKPLLGHMIKRNEILEWLHEEDPIRLQSLWRRADLVRRKRVGDAVHLRGLVEFSNVCARNCLYCGMRAGRHSLARYRMTEVEIVACARKAVAHGYGTVVMQSGEDPGLDIEWLSRIIRLIKRKTPLSVTLSCGERSREDLVCWRAAGADRYLLRFETSDRALWHRIHPRRKQDAQDRIEILGWVRELGYETGSGIMVGIPGQTWDSLADDLEWFRRLDLDMIGIGPYVPHADTPLGRVFHRSDQDPNPSQVPNTELMTYKVMALTRLLCPCINIPSTTALATINPKHGSELGLRRGANVLMVNMTPLEYRVLYDIYPAKACIAEMPQIQRKRVAALLADLGRSAGVGPGGSLRREKAGGITAGAGL